MTERDSGKVKHFGVVAPLNNVIGTVEEQAFKPVVPPHNIAVKSQHDVISFVLVSDVPETIQNQPNSGEIGNYSGFV